MNRHGVSQHSLARWIRRWHARMGIAAALFFLVLIVTGIALNHTERLGLAQTPVRSEALTSWYGLPPVRILAVYAAGEFIATPTDWLYRGKRLTEGGGAVVGVKNLPNMLVVATEESLSLYTHSGERIEILRGNALPAHAIIGVGSLNETIVLKTAAGLFGSPDGLDWQTVSGSGVIWSYATAPDANISKRVSEQVAPSLPLERIVLDLHSGRLLGRFGPYLMDGAAIILLVLSLSGVWIQWRNWRQKRRHPHKG